MNGLAINLTIERPEEKLLNRLCLALSEYLDPAQIDEVVRAYQFSADAHHGQYRKSGEAYICHPLSVALLLSEMRMDVNGIIAAILHDVLEDTPVDKAQIAELFNPEVAELVDGVTKLTQLDCRSRAEAQAENVRKMFLAMARDLRVIMVKLADRLHNMQTLGAMPPAKRRRIAKETLDIYAPIANRLGMNKIRQQLEQLGFAAMFPLRYRILENAVKKARGNRHEIIDTIESSLRNRLRDYGLLCEVVGREKNLYSIYQKMQGKKISFAEVFDVYAFRILCDEVDTCYRALGVVHNLFKPIPGRFKDYIALPKANGYQSLHTVLVGPYGVPIEIQIRTHQMHRMSESGIAAHWLYKSDDEKSNSQARANEWLRDLLEIQKTAGDSLEFIDNLKIDLFPQEVFVFTPQGGIIKLPRGATVVDFAYAVHTDLGNTCISARIDRRLVPLQTKLENGVTVEIITAPWAKPNPLWLNYVLTAKARSSIRAHLKHCKQQEAIDLGRRLLDSELRALNASLNHIDAARLQALLKRLAVPHLDGLLEDIGLGNRMPFLIAKQLVEDTFQETLKLDGNEKGAKTPLIIKGTEGMVVTLAKCCRPIPGDPIVGYFSPGRGIVVHHDECRNHTRELRRKHVSGLDVEWSREVNGEFPADLRIELFNQRGTLATVASTISSMESNIENVQVVDQDDRVSVDLITLTARDRVHLAQIMRALKKLPSVIKITRIKA